MAFEVTDAHLQQYHDEGYTLIRELIPRDIIEAAGRRAQEVTIKDVGFTPRRFHGVDPKRYTREDGSPLPLGIQRPALEEQVFKDVVDHPNLIEAMEKLLGGSVELFTDQMAVKHGFITEEQGSCSFYHQDSYYWKIDPELGCNCWIPTQDVDRNAIALAVMPGSHKDWKLIPHEDYFDDPPLTAGLGGEPFKRHRIPLDQVDFSKEELFPMNAGDGLFFTNYTWHRSEPNKTGRTMSFYAIAYRLAQQVADAAKEAAAAK